MRTKWLWTAAAGALALAGGEAQAQVAGGAPPVPDPAAGAPAGAPAADASRTPPAPEASSAGAPGTPGAPPVAGGLEEIVVTAQKRSENLQNVPIAVSAVTASQLSRSGVGDLVDIKVAVPSLNLVSQGPYLTSSLRGIGSNAIGAGIENPIALYIDGVYYGAPSASLVTLNDVAQVEVLKGPQGTLFGRNATGGLIQVTTRTPGDKPTGDVNLAYANYNLFSGNAYLAGPLTDRLFASVAAAGTHQGNGWGRNLADGHDVYRVDRDIAFRGKLVFEASAATRLVLSGDYSNRADSMQTFTTVPGTIPGWLPALGPARSMGYDVANSVDPFTRTRAAGASLRWEQKVGSLNFVSLTAFRRSRTHFLFDYDGLAQPFETVDETNHDRQFSQELQLSSRSGGRFTWLAGAYFFDANARLDPFILTANDLGARVTLHNRQSTRSVAGYAQATYKVLDGTNLTLGGRYTTEKRRAYDGVTDVFVIPLAVALPSAPSPDMKRTFRKFTYRASLDHRFSDEVLVYASYNRGFKSGGYNTSAPGTPSFLPEKLDAYELGVKTDLFDRTVRINLSGFYYDYDQIQIQQLNAGAITVINGAKARDYGLDADFAVQVSTAFRLNGGVTWISPKFTSFPNCLRSTPAGGVPSFYGSCAGNQIPLSTKFSATIGADYVLRLGSGSLDLSGTLNHSSGFYPESDNIIKQKSYELINASARYTFSGGLSVGVYGKNLINRRLINFESTVPNGSHATDWQAPRTYGVTVGYKF